MNFEIVAFKIHYLSLIYFKKVKSFVKMQIPINKLTKMFRTFPQWSTAMTVTFCLYLLFIMVVLSISFPLKSHKTHLMLIKRNHVNENTVMDIVNDNNELGNSEEKLVQRAKELPTVSNRTEILRDAFNK